MSDEQQAAADAASNSGDDKGADYWKAEAQKAFKDRDGIKGKLRDLEGRVMSEDDRALFDSLKEQQAKAAEEKKRKAGEFDAWRADITKKHDESLKSEQEKAKTYRSKLEDTLKSHAFASANEWFGGSDAKTILTPAIAAAYFGRFVAVETADDGLDRVVVKGTDGHAILDVKTGQPAEFRQAIGELIASLPDKDSILRGSGKTGSGSSGGSHKTSEALDLTRLKSSDFSDPKVREAVKARQATAGGLQIGRAFDRVSK